MPALYRPPPLVTGGVAAQGAVGERCRAVVRQTAAVAVELEPPEMVRPESEAVTPLST